ncbi:MAG: catalase [Provencibacterium sp.]|nr:catalase [Provencibacterium sp.]
MTNGWYQLKPESGRNPPGKGPELPGPSTERFYQEMKEVYARAISGKAAARTAEDTQETAAAPAEETAEQPPISLPEEEAEPSPPNTSSSHAAENQKTEKRPPTMHEIERSFTEKPRAHSPLPRAAEEGEPSSSLTAGEGGPVLLQDMLLQETLKSFLYERPAGRILHAKGFGALGYFLTEQPMQPFTTLSFLQTAGRRIPAAARFSLALGGPGTPDTSRNLRGFSVKFYADDGNFDLLCTHIPVFMVRDALRFPEAVRCLSPAPESGLNDGRRFWEFVARRPEALHFALWLYSDYGTLKSFRGLRACSVNTYIWRNAKGERRYVKYHLLPAAEGGCLSRQEAAHLAGTDPDIAGRELYETIAAGMSAEYTLCVQLMDPADRQTLPYDPLDCTRLWDEKRYPLLPVGRLVLDRNPFDYRQQVENIAFSPANLLPGAELSEDRLLQGRAALYWDAQRLRLGADFRELPINCRRNRARWSPASLNTSGLQQPLCGQIGRFSENSDDFTPAGEYFRSLSEIEREHLAENLADGLLPVKPEIQSILLRYFEAADSTLAEAVRGCLSDAR